MVSLLELPDALADVAGVAPRGDAPERVGRLHDVRALGAGSVRAAGDEADRDGRDDEDQEELAEHVFAMLERTGVRVKDYFRLTFFFGGFFGLPLLPGFFTFPGPQEIIGPAHAALPSAKSGASCA